MSEVRRPVKHKRMMVFGYGETASAVEEYYYYAKQADAYMDALEAEVSRYRENYGNAMVRIAELEAENQRLRALERAHGDIQMSTPICQQTAGPGHVYRKRCIYCGREDTHE